MASRNKNRGTKGGKRPAARRSGGVTSAGAGALAGMLATWFGVEPMAPDVLARARVRQISILIRQTPLMAAISILNSALLAIALWQTTPHALLLGWVGVVWVVWAVVMLRWRRQRRREPPSTVSRATMRHAVMHTSLAGALWGFGAIILFPPDAPLQQLVLAFVIGGMGAGAVAAMSSFPAACHAFILASVLPFVFSFLRVGNYTSLVMAAMAVVYVAALIVVSRIGYRTFLDGIRTEFENKNLLDLISATHARLVDSIESVPAGIVFCDADDRLVVCNSRYRQWMCPGREAEIVTGMKFGDLVEMSADAVLGPVSAARRRSWVRTSLKQHRNPKKPTEIVFADGRFVRVHERRTEDGGTISVLTDITDLRQHEEDMAAQSRLMKVTFESMAQGLVAFDKDLTILASNKHLATLLGLPGKMLSVGRSFGEVIEMSARRGDYGPGEPAQLAAKYKKLAKGRKAHSFERRLADGTVIEVRDVSLGGGGSVVTYTDITERKRAEEAVLLGEQKFRYLVEGSIQGIVISDRDMTIVFANQAAADMHGYDDPADMLTIGHCKALMGKGERQRLSAYHDARLGGGEEAPPHYEFMARRKDGSSFWVHNQPKLIEWEGKPATQNILIDVTERKQAEDRVHRAEQQLRDGIDSISDGFVLYGADERLIMCNEQYLEIYKYPHGYNGIVGSGLEELCRTGLDNGLIAGPLARKNPKKWLEQRLKRHRNPTDEPSEYEMEDGRWIMVSERRTREGGIVGIHTDITALKRAEMRLRDAVESLPEAFALYDADDRLVILNEKYREFYAMTGGAIRIGARFEDIIRAGIERGQYPEAEGRANEFIAERLALHRKPGALIEQKLSDGRWLRIVERRTREGGTVGVRADITEHKQREAALRKSQSELSLRVAELEEMQRQLETQGAELRQLAQHLAQARDEASAASKTKSDFLANMSHELRTPLNAVIGFSEIMSGELLGPVGTPQYKQYAADIHDSGTHLLSLINDILDLSKIEAGRMELHEERVDFAAIVESAVRVIGERAAEAKLALEVDLEDGFPRLYVDDRAHKQILLNLLSNAVKFTKPGGLITICARQAGKDGVTISVTDSGLGMEAGDIEKALAPFGQIDSSMTRKHAGSGLGLPLVKSLVELHGGRLRIDSEPGKGTCVSFTLPPERVLTDERQLARPKAG